MAFTEEQNRTIRDYVTANINNPAAIAAAAIEFGVSPQALATAVGVTENEVINYFNNAGVTPPPPALPVTTAPVVSAPSSVVASAASSPVQTEASTPSWDYDEYVSKLKTGNADFNQELGKLGGVMGQNAQNVYREILTQQNAGTAPAWYAGNTASPQAAAADFALRLAENGIGSLTELGQTRTVLDLGEDGGLQDNTVLFNKATGQPIPRPELLGRGTRGLDIDYQIDFAPDGTAVPYTSNRSSSWMNFREDTLKPAAMFVGSILAGQAFGGAGAGASAATDASFLAADAAQLAAQGLSESAIAQVLSAPGYASTAAANLAASMAANGLDVGMMTQQLNALNSSTGLMSQTGSSADFLAADAVQLQGQLGNNFAAIEQNLIASGVDPLIAADISQQLAFNPGLTQTQLATNLSTSFGNNIYDVNTATTYPTTVLPGSGGLLSDVTGTTTTTGTGTGTTTGTGTGTTTGTTTGTGTDTGTGTTTTGLTATQIGNIIKAGVGLLGTSAAVNAAGSGGSTTPMQTPTQGVPTYTPEYYNQLQQYYNAYLPQTPRDVVTPLQQWYNS